MSKRVEAAADRPDPEADAPAAEIEFPLSKPIIAYGDEVTVLKLRKPTGVDLIRIGNPVTFYPHLEPPKIEHDMERVVAMVARLAGVPSSSLERLEPDELVGLAWAISPFFIPAR
jgi:hypothetical protein